jgi:hypothetical protein
LTSEPLYSKDNEKLRDYEKKLTFVNEYSGLRRKITFDLLYEIHLIHVDILGRLASFATDWERDMHFLLLGLYNLEKQNKIEKLLSFKNKDEVDSIFKYTPEKSMVVKFKAALNIDINKKTLEWLCSYNCKESLGNVINVRNALAHLNHMTQISYKSKNDKYKCKYQKSIIDLLARVSKLLNYDLKRKNSVTRVLKELLKKYHINLSLYQKSDYEYELYTKEDCKCNHKRPSIESENIVHLKDVKIGGSKKGITIPAKDELFVKCIEKLLNFSYNETEDKKSAK